MMRLATLALHCSFLLLACGTTVAPTPAGFAQARFVATATPSSTPEVPLPTWGPSDPLQRDVMVDRAMGERSPRPVDFRLVTIAELADTKYVSLGEEAANYGPPTKQVFVVRLAGRFTPLDLPYEVDETWPKGAWRIQPTTQPQARCSVVVS